MYASKSTNAFHIILHNFIYFKTTRQRPYSLNLILKSKPNILSAKHYYFSFLNKCYCCWLCFCPKSSRRHTWFFRVQINCYKTSKQSSFNFNLQCKSSFIQCSKVHIIPILKVHLSVKVSVFLYPWIDDVRTLLRVWGGVRDMDLQITWSCHIDMMKFGVCYSGPKAFHAIAVCSDTHTHHYAQLRLGT